MSEGDDKTVSDPPERKEVLGKDEPASQDSTTPAVVTQSPGENLDDPLPSKDECIESHADSKSDDKREIADEEREKMIADEKRVPEEDEEDEVKRIKGSEVEKKKKALEEAALEPAKRRVPIGGIKIPGFLRPKSRDKNKDGAEGDVEEGTDLLEAATPATEDAAAASKGDQQNDQGPASRLAATLARLERIKFSNPFARFTKNRGGDNSGGEGGEGEGGEDQQPKKPSGAKLLNAVKLPLASVLPKLRPTHQNKEGEAGRAPTEPTDDSDYKIDENNMENIKLENEVDAEKAALEEEAESKWANKDWRFFYKRFYEFRYPIIGLLVLFILLVILIAVAVSGSSVPTHAPIVDGKYITAITSCGPVQGVMKEGVFVFGGLPWAVPPVGGLRWSPPRRLQLEDCWNSTLLAHNASNACWHLSPDGEGPSGTEDCLYLDVITPHVRYDSPLPVVVVIGADSLGIGVGEKKLAPALSLVREKEIVFVLPNIRYSVFGFLAATPLSQSTYPYTSGNYALHDLKHVLRWVQLNIEHFGGDKNAVTVLAHRSAATLMTVLTATLKPENLFARAWLASGSAVFPNKTLIESERMNDGYLASLRCGEKPTAECLRRQHAEELMSSTPPSWRSGLRDLPDNYEEQHETLVHDGIIIRQHPTQVWNNGNLSVQLIIGTTRHSEYKKNSTLPEEDEVTGRLKQSDPLSGLVDEVISRYGASPASLHAIIADIRTVCPLYALHQSINNSRFYLVTKGRGSNDMSDGLMDVEAILGLYKGGNAEERRYVAHIQRIFYRYVTSGAMPQHRITLIGHEETSDKEMDNCYFWNQNNFTQFARID